MTTPEEIKNWLEKNRKDRLWLAEKCLVSKRTVDNWLSEGRNIPPRKLGVIESLIQDENKGTQIEERRQSPETQLMILKFTEKEWQIIQEYKRLHPGINLEEKAEEIILTWSKEIEDEIGIENNLNQEQTFLTAEEPAEYGIPLPPGVVSVEDVIKSLPFPYRNKIKGKKKNQDTA